MFPLHLCLQPCTNKQYLLSIQLQHVYNDNLGSFPRQCTVIDNNKSTHEKGEMGVETVDPVLAYLGSIYRLGLKISINMYGVDNIAAICLKCQQTCNVTR
jgi:hypothetical protein